jgi:diacylglycerol kinase family enzyme
MPNVETAVRAATTHAAPRLRTIAAVVNPAAGSLRPGAGDQLRELVADFGYELRLFTVEAQNVEQVVREAVSSGPDLLVVLAGDGTARLAAERCGPEGPLLAPLPGGTLNMLPHALYGVVPWPEALRTTLDKGTERAVSGGRICGRPFYVAAVLGAPALWGGAREALRAGKLGEAKRRVELALKRAFVGGLRYGARGEAGRPGEALALICPLVSKACETDCALEMAALDFHNAREMVRLAFNGVTGDWRNDPSVSIEHVERGWATMRGSIPSILDGETQKLPRHAAFEFVPRAFRALAPPHAAVASL